MQIETIEIALRVALVIDSIAMIALVLIQQGKGASVGAAFGSGAAQTMFGSAGASSFLNSLTTWLAVGFFAITFGLAWTAKERAETLGTAGIPQVEAPAPAANESEGFDLPESTMDAPAADSDASMPTLDATPATEADVPAVDAGAADEEMR